MEKWFGSLASHLLSTEFMRSHGMTHIAHETAGRLARVDNAVYLADDPADSLNRLKALRTFVDTGMTAYKKSVNAIEGSKWLGESRDAIIQYYQDPAIIARATAIHKDGKAEYNMLPEMWRDMARYNLCLVELFGMPQFLDTAIACFDQAILLSPDISSSRGLAMMEKQMALQEGARPEYRYEELQSGYEMSKAITEKEGNWDRLSVTSLWHGREALKQKQYVDALHSAATMVKADINGKHMPFRHLKEFFKPFYRWARRTTFDTQTIRIEEMRIFKEKTLQPKRA